VLGVGTGLRQGEAFGLTPEHKWWRAGLYAGFISEPPDELRSEAKSHDDLRKRIYIV
jgi:hypothetical protein